MGVSPRAAIDFVLVAEQLAELRDVIPSRAPEDEEARRTLVAAAQTAFSVKIIVREAARRTADEVVEEVVNAALSGLPSPEEDPEPSESAPDQTGDGASPESGDAEGQPRHSYGEGTGVPGSSSGASEQMKAGGEVYGLSAQRAAGQRMYGAFAKEYPGIAEQLGRGESGFGALEEALEVQSGDRLEILGEMTDLCDRPDLRTLARRLARELVLREARQSVAGRSGRGCLLSVPYDGHVAELDLDRSLECILSTPRPDDKGLYVLDRRHYRRACTLILDTSGSMKGPALLETCVC